MNNGFKATLFAGAITLSAFAPAFAAAPVISGLPDVQIGDMEDSSATDSNTFVFTDAFDFDDYVTDSDTAKGDLQWSFAEFDGGLGNSEYTINGFGAINEGDTAIADEETNGFPTAKAPTNNINTSGAETFRNIILSPPGDAPPYPDPSTQDAQDAANGKFLRYYVSDPDGNVAFQDAMITTVDDGFDSLTAANAYEEQVRDSDLNGPGWVKSGALSNGISSAKSPGQLNITVSPTTGESRFAGWVNNDVLSYDAVGPNKFVRGKFYVYTNKSVLQPVNEVPSFRLRLTNEDAVSAEVNYEYNQTGYSDPRPGGDPNDEPGYATLNNPTIELLAGYWVRPGDIASTPSLYTVDFDPVDVPAATGTNIGALIETYQVTDPADATLSLTELVLGTYGALEPAHGTLIFDYDRGVGLSAGAGGQKSMTGGPLNAEPNFTPGRLRDVYIPQTNPEQNYASNTDEGANGLVASTAAVSNTVFGIDLLNVESSSNDDKLRIEPGKLYMSKFYATSAVPTSSVNPLVATQANMAFRFQTGGSTIIHRLSLSSAATIAFDGTATSEIATQALPGVGSQNPDTDATLDTPAESGGWYTVVTRSPLDLHAIRADYEDALVQITGEPFFSFSLQPGPGNTTPSTKDVTLGIDLVQSPANLTVLGSTQPFSRPSNGIVRLSAVKVYEYPSLDDGGYDFSGN